MYFFFFFCFFLFFPLSVRNKECAAKIDFEGHLTSELDTLLECNWVKLYAYRNDQLEPEGYLDFAKELEQFHWFLKHYLSVPFSIPPYLKKSKYVLKRKQVLLQKCADRTWVTEFLKTYNEPLITSLLEYMIQSQLEFFKFHFPTKKLKTKYTSFTISHFENYCISPIVITSLVKQGKEINQFQLNHEEYAFFLKAKGSLVTKLQQLVDRITDRERKFEFITILDGQVINETCKGFTLKLPYEKFCRGNDTYFQCIDKYIRNVCTSEETGDLDASFCFNLYFVLKNLSVDQTQEFVKFLDNDKISLAKPSTVWKRPIFKEHTPETYSKEYKIDIKEFKQLRQTNGIFLTFVQEVPTNSNIYNMEFFELIPLNNYTFSVLSTIFIYM